MDKKTFGIIQIFHQIVLKIPCKTLSLGALSEIALFLEGWEPETGGQTSEIRSQRKTEDSETQMTEGGRRMTAEAQRSNVGNRRSAKA